MGKEPIVKFWEVVNILTDGSVIVQFSWFGLWFGVGFVVFGVCVSACLRVCVLRAACLFVSLCLLSRRVSPTL